MKIDLRKLSNVFALRNFPYIKRDVT